VNEKYPEFSAVHLVQFDTPKGVKLSGYWIGALRPKRVIIWTHGLGSTMFSKLDIARLLAKDRTAVLMYNNRGHDYVSRISTTKKSTKSRLGGSAYEVFTESADDISGAIRFAKKTAAKEIVLVGHSTGCQKSVYWAQKNRGGRGVDGIVLLAPISDYAGETKLQGKAAVQKNLAIARALVRQKRSMAIVGDTGLCAQRYVSLYAGEGPEEVFPYWAGRKSIALSQIKVPTLVVLAQDDEYADRPASEMGAWFFDQLYDGEVIIVPRADHSLAGAESAVARAVQRFMKEW
jgi:pimeloyl-ACP methyl ester carboxylesterase